MSSPKAKWRSYPPMLSPNVSPPHMECSEMEHLKPDIDDAREKVNHLAHIISEMHRRKLLMKQKLPEDEPEVQRLSNESEFLNKENSIERRVKLKARSKLSSPEKPVKYEEKSENPLNVEKLIFELEARRRLNVEQAVLTRKDRMAKFVESIRAASLAKLEEKLGSIRIDEETYHQQVASEDASANFRLQEVQETYRKQHLQHEQERKARLEAALAAEEEATAKEKAIQEHYEEARRREEELKEEELKNIECVIHLKESYSNFESVLKRCQVVLDAGQLQHLIVNSGLDLVALTNIMAGGSKVDISLVPDLISGMERVSEHLEKQISEVQNQKEEQAKAEEAAHAAATSAAITASKQAAEAAEAANQQEQAATATYDDISPANHERYVRLMNFKSEFEAGFQQLLADKEMKSFVFLCKKAVNTPVNSIGRTTPSHLMDKISKLLSLLRGQMVEVQDSQFSAASHPQGVAFCKSLLAAKLVRQGEDVIRAQAKDAFTVATVVITLWAEFPDFGDLFLAHMFETCPFLIPCHFGKHSGMTDEEYYKRLGYAYDSQNKVEDQVNFEGRMGGVARLYSAVMVTSLPKDWLRTHRDHPHGLGNAWAWIAACLNMKPINGVTTTLLVNILDVCGHAMLQKYKSQFKVLMATVAQSYFPLLASISLEASKNRLQMLLEKIGNGSLKSPDGILQAGFL